jgi:hypothetical protein
VERGENLLGMVEAEMRENANIPFGRAEFGVGRVLHAAARPLQRHLGHLAVASSGLIERRADDLHGVGGFALHFRNFFRPFVNQKDYQPYFRTIGADGVCHFLQQNRFACSRWCHYQTSLTFAYGRYQIYYPHVQFFGNRLKD